MQLEQHFLLSWPGTVSDPDPVGFPCTTDSRTTTDLFPTFGTAPYSLGPPLGAEEGNYSLSVGQVQLHKDRIQGSSAGQTAS